MCLGCLLSPLYVSAKLDCGRLACLLQSQLQPVAAILMTAAAPGRVMAQWMAKLYKQ